MTKAERVDAIVRDVLYRDHEIVDGVPIVPPISTEAVVTTFGFHPDRVAAHRAEIIELLADFPDEFYASKGGGWSFLNFCQTRDGRQWTGEHSTMEALMALGIAVGAVTVLMPREMWSALPGGMPYIAIEDMAAVTA